MVIAKTTSRNVAYKANKLGELMFARQSEMLMPEEELGSQSPGSYEEDFEDLSSNADLYVFNDQMAQGYRGVNINTRDDEESVGEMHMKDYIDVSNQENVAPVYFRSLSLGIKIKRPTISSFDVVFVQSSALARHLILHVVLLIIIPI